jgi:hypothetical protein
VGKSRLTFDDPEPGALPSSGVPVNRPFAWPPGRRFTVTFTQSVDTASAAAGDPIRAKLTTAIRDDSSKILVPAGAAVTVRIVKMQHFYGPASSSLTLAVKLETVEVKGTPQPIAARQDTTMDTTKDTTRADTSRARFAKENGLGRRVELGTLDTLEDRTAGVFEFRDAKASYVVKDGLESAWVTLAP